MTRPGEELPHEVEIVLGRSLGHRREPRVRFSKNRPGAHLELGRNMTRRAAFRAAREQRDKHGERRPLRVWQIRPHLFGWGVSVWLDSESPGATVDPSNGGSKP